MPALHRRSLFSLFAIALVTATTGLALAARPAPLVIVRDTGGIVGPSFDLVVFADHTWQFRGRGEHEGNAKGKTDAAAVAKLIAAIEKAGFDKAESIKPSPAPHAQLLLKRGGKVTSIFLKQNDPLMTVARAEAMKIVKPAEAAEAEATVKIILLGGQSNMAGVGKAAGLKPPYDTPFANVPVWSPRAKAWVPLTPEAVNGRGRFGPEVSFARAIDTLMPDDDVRLVKYAVGGTALYNDWAPTTGGQYKGFMNTARAALADLDASNTKYEVVGMLWLQGESDAHENKAETYEKNLTAFIAHMREQFDAPGMPFIIARVMNHYGGKSGQAKIVRDAQQKIGETDPRAAWFDTDGLPLNDPGHYKGDGLIEIGKRFAKAYGEVVGREKKN